MNPPGDDRRGAAPGERSDAMRRKAAEASAKGMSFLQPRLHQAWCNLRVWLPFFDTPNRRARQIKFAHSDCRTGFYWDIDLPKQCCRCGRADDLRGEHFESLVRAFEYPLHITGTAALMSAGVLFLAFIAFSFGMWSTLLSLLIFTMVIILAASVLLWMKSWDEEVSLRLFACPDHVADLKQPDLVVHDNDLTIVLPSERFADAAMEELKQRRRGKHRAAGESSIQGRSASGVQPPAAIPIDSPPLPPRPHIPDLPPIKLAGEEDDLLPQ